MVKMFWSLFFFFLFYAYICELKFYMGLRREVAARMSCLMSVFAVLKYEFFKAVRGIVMG